MDFSANKTFFIIHFTMIELANQHLGSTVPIIDSMHLVSMDRLGPFPKFGSNRACPENLEAGAAEVGARRGGRGRGEGGRSGGRAGHVTGLALTN